MYNVHMSKHLASSIEFCKINIIYIQQKVQGDEFMVTFEL